MKRKKKGSSAAAFISLAEEKKRKKGKGETHWGGEKALHCRWLVELFFEKAGKGEKDSRH